MLLIMEPLLALWKHSGTLLTLQGSVAFKRKALEQVDGSLNFNPNLPPWLGKLLNTVRVHFLHPSGRHGGTPNGPPHGAVGAS